jgi:uncharacterized protein YjbJ (UPF0337 family)/ElaB/YqjD/DUF883 family membrane-anchored ribosome-binding protein
MVTRQQLEGKWNEVSGRLKEKWGALTDDDLSRAEGNVEQLVGVIQQKTGNAREEVEAFIDAVVTGSKKTTDRIMSNAKDYANTAKDYAANAASSAKEYAATARDAAGEYAAQAQDAMRQGYDSAEQMVSEGYQKAEECVRKNPVESLAISFGAGLLSGVLVALMLRERR